MNAKAQTSDKQGSAQINPLSCVHEGGASGPQQAVKEQAFVLQPRLEKNEGTGNRTERRTWQQL